MCAGLIRPHGPLENMSIRENALNAAIRLLRGTIRLTGARQAGAITARLAEGLSPTIEAPTPFGTLRFFCPGHLPEFRARTLLTKEPETLRWIETFDSGDVLWDIGANVGSYSLYAGLRGMRTLAFEPSAGNYHLLNRNIEINRMDDRISAYCLAFSDDTRLAAFHMQSTEVGSALSSFAEATDWQGRPFSAVFEQAMMGFDIDGFIRQFSPAFPTHIKIDVDGREDKIVAGARATLADPRLKSVLIELDGGRESYTQEVVRRMADAGLILVETGHAVEIANRASSAFYLYIFRRGGTA